jgi:hypothetical protein
MKRVHDAQMQRVADESRSYVGAGDKKKTASVRDGFQKRIQELESTGKALRDRQKNIKEAADTAKRQVKLWRDTEMLLQAKIDATHSGTPLGDTAPPPSPSLGRSNSLTRSAGGARAAGVNRLVVD